MKTFSSVLATTIRDYLTLKRALGREYEREEWVLARLDRFLAARHADLIAETFAAWCLTLQNLASGVRRGQMRHVRNLCLYRRRREPGCFVPDERLFPPLHQVIQPHIFTDAQVAQLLAVGPLERSEEHTSELQSRRDLVCRLLLEKKKIQKRRLKAPASLFIH